jgi:hypothetical protein
VEPEAVSEARRRLADWLDDAGGEGAEISREVRLMLVAGGFDREVTTTVLWLNEVYGLDIRCVRLNPYKIADRLLLDVQQVIPLPEASDLMVRLRRRQTKVRAARSDGGPDWTPYVIETPDGPTEPLRKRRAVLALAKALADAGVAAHDIAASLPASKMRSVSGPIEGEALVEAFLTSYPAVAQEKRGLRRWFFEAPFHDGEQTWVLSKMWGVNTEAALDALVAIAPGSGYGYRAEVNGLAIDAED